MKDCSINHGQQREILRLERLAGEEVARELDEMPHDALLQGGVRVLIALLLAHRLEEI